MIRLMLWCQLSSCLTLQPSFAPPPVRSLPCIQLETKKPKQIGTRRRTTTTKEQSTNQGCQANDFSWSGVRQRNMDIRKNNKPIPEVVFDFRHECDQLATLAKFFSLNGFVLEAGLDTDNLAENFLKPGTVYPSRRTLTRVGYANRICWADHSFLKF
ncbi:hypothetical protein BJY04DRAFT_136824 [Aspergillus karnatakaensis]|uniref:uncharacterized protein n=1 Tax=Aspergillus karnatakaensis TaxID=1810916 RepID=UPI003CCC9F9F